MTMNKTYDNFSMKKMPKSRVEITASIPAATFDSVPADCP